ncbi:MAG: hypothetical protein J0H44_19935 [Alphaproteobacteria bacterium]|nr:hypothetical protein [Alphaproteobacteria bacterium]
MHEDIEHRLGAVRRSFQHPGTLGDASETVWLDLLRTYLPHRYSAASAHVVDSKGKFSEQIDIVIFDRQYTPFIFHFAGKAIVPAEGVYAVLEAKQSINAAQIKYAMQKVGTVRALKRTTLDIPTAGGLLKAKKPAPILGGLVTLESDWKPPMGNPLQKALNANSRGRLDIGCVAAHGMFVRDVAKAVLITKGGKPAAAFLFELISRLQELATVPRIDIAAYARWLRN